MAAYDNQALAAKNAALASVDVSKPVSDQLHKTINDLWAEVALDGVTHVTGIFHKIWEIYPETKAFFPDNTDDYLAKHVPRFTIAFNAVVLNINNFDAVREKLMHYSVIHKNVAKFTHVTFWLLYRPFLEYLQSTWGNKWTKDVHYAFQWLITFVLVQFEKGFEEHH